MVGTSDGGGGVNVWAYASSKDGARASADAAAITSNSATGATDAARNLPAGSVPPPIAPPPPRAAGAARVRSTAGL